MTNWWKIAHFLHFSKIGYTDLWNILGAIEKWFLVDCSCFLLINIRVICENWLWNFWRKIRSLLEPLLGWICACFWTVFGAFVWHWSRALFCTICGYFDTVLGALYCFIIAGNISSLVGSNLVQIAIALGALVTYFCKSGTIVFAGISGQIFHLDAGQLFMSLCH